jgi:hypothetical protein
MYMYTGRMVPVQGRSPLSWGSSGTYHVTRRLLTRLSQHFLNGSVPCGVPPHLGFKVCYCRREAIFTTAELLWRVIVFWTICWYGRSFSGVVSEYIPSAICARSTGL